jgi:putative endonuclease
MQENFLSRGYINNHIRFLLDAANVPAMASGGESYRHAFAGVPTRTVLRILDWLAEHTLPPQKIAAHHRTGRRGEEAAYFYLRKLGYTMVARNFRSPRCRGEIDLIAWDDDVLCFIEVKTRTTRDVKPGEAAVDQHKRRQIAAVAREYLRGSPLSCQWRFDVVSVYYDQSQSSRPQIEIFRNASLKG